MDFPPFPTSLHFFALYQEIAEAQSALVLFGNEIKHLQKQTEARGLRFPLKASTYGVHCM
jgi:hypothetical protein